MKRRILSLAAQNQPLNKDIKVSPDGFLGQGSFGFVMKGKKKKQIKISFSKTHQ